MKKHLILLLSFSLTWSSFAQGRFEFVVNLSGSGQLPPTSSLGTASGTLTLVDLELAYDIFHPWSPPLNNPIASIRGPATESSLGPVFFDLGRGTDIMPPSSVTTWGGVFGLSSLQLTPMQRDLLVSESLWISLATPEFPDGEIAGRIRLVPEPSTLAMFLAGALLVVFTRVR